METLKPFVPGEKPFPENPELPPKLPPVEPLPPTALPAAFRGFAEDTARRLSCPFEFVAAGAMAVAGSAIGRSLAIYPKQNDDWKVFANLWAAAVGLPASMKSPALGEVMAPVSRIEESARAEWQKRFEAWQKEEALFQVRLRGAKAAGEKKAREAAEKGTPASLTPLPEPPEKPPCPRLLIQDSTAEKLVEIATENPRGLLLFRDELAAWLKGFEKAGRESERAFFLETAEGKNPLSVDRIGRGSTFCPPIALGILGGIQPGMLKAIFDNSPDDGLLQRFGLLVWPDIPKEPFKMIDAAPDTAARMKYFATVERLAGLNRSPNAPEVGTPDEAAPYLRFSPDAAAMFREHFEGVTNRLRRGELPEALSGHLSKLAGKTVPGLALICCLADEERPAKVGAEHLERALVWSRVLESHARRLYTPQASPEVEAAYLIAAKMRAGALGEEFTAREVGRKEWSGIDRESAEAALELLESRGFCRERKRLPGKNGGRPSATFEVNPNLRNR
jgi:putative DNA primase/helicase